ncbi:hypothetical protein [Flavobacterium davisii]|uniref:hypothetical protein n=1 Tax=Flavobacterium davisii TaxID=2906077 RepID=UPI0035CECE28
MINKLTIIFILCACCKMNAQQIKYVSRDTILNIFKNNNVYDAIDKIRDQISYERGDLDYKSLYFDKEIKTYFLKSLDRNSRCQYELENKNREYIKLLDDKKRLEYEVESYLYRKKRSKQIDSILKSEKLILKLKDSVIADRILLYKNGRDCKGAIPNLYLITKIKYPEAYDSIKKWSKELLEWNFTEELLAFNDPDAVNLFNEKVNNYVKTNGKNESFRDYHNIVSYINTSSINNKLYDLLLVNRQEVIMSEHVFNADGTFAKSNSIYTSPNFDFAGKVFYLVDKYKLPYELIKNEFDKVAKSNDISIKDKFVKKNIKILKKIVIEGCSKMEKEEEYWMVNMPFYKKKL